MIVVYWKIIETKQNMNDMKKLIMDLDVKTNELFESRLKLVDPAIKKQVNYSFDVVNRIHFLLDEKGMKQKDLAKALNKKESEISKWMHGTHNFTLDTLASIEHALGEPIIQICNSLNDK